MQTYPIRLPADLLDRIRQAAAQDRRPIQQWIRVALEDVITARSGRRKEKANEP